MKRCTLFTLILSASLPAIDGRECIPHRNERITNDFYFTASSDQGSAGDVVAVDIALTVENFSEDLIGIGTVVCYDHRRAELIPEPLYSDSFDELFFLSSFLPLTGLEGEQGFRLGGVVRRETAALYFGSGDPVYLATVFFRVTGVPGETVSVTFCDNVFGPEGGTCDLNYLGYWSDAEGRTSRSTRHVAAEIRILEGTPTRTEPPALPPLARV